MAHSDPLPPRTDDPEPLLDALRRAGARLDDRLRTVESMSAAAGPQPPPGGWQRGREDGANVAATLTDALRDALPPELRRQLVEALRALLVALRALIEWLLDRLEARRARPVEVQDIPIS